MCVSLCVCVCAFQTVQKLFKHRFGKELSFSDRMEFVNLWYFLIIVNDAFTIVGSAFKIRLETRVRAEQGVSDVHMEGHCEHFQYTKLLAKQKWKTFDCLLENVHVCIIIITKMFLKYFLSPNALNNTNIVEHMYIKIKIIIDAANK